MPDLQVIERRSLSMRRTSFGVFSSLGGPQAATLPPKARATPSGSRQRPSGLVPQVAWANVPERPPRGPSRPHGPVVPNSEPLQVGLCRDLLRTYQARRVAARHHYNWQGRDYVRPRQEATCLDAGIGGRREGGDACPAVGAKPAPGQPCARMTDLTPLPRQRRPERRSGFASTALS